MRYAIAVLGMAALVLAGCSSNNADRSASTAAPVVRTVAPQAEQIYVAPPAPPPIYATAKPSGSVVTPVARPAPRKCPPRCCKPAPC